MVPVISLSYAHLALIIVALIAFFWWFYKVALTRTVDRRIRNYQKDLLERDSGIKQHSVRLCRRWFQGSVGARHS
ncbi:MAG TPA: hypothetical protein PLK04_12035 [Bacillota bacterium]|nr:hypothetical protein [Bacillota bacterium]